MASKSWAACVDNTSRKTWDKAEYADKAKERQKTVSICKVYMFECGLKKAVILMLFQQSFRLQEGDDDGVIEARKRKRMGE